MSSRPTLASEIVAVSRRFGVLSRFTAFVAVVAQVPAVLDGTVPSARWR